MYKEKETIKTEDFVREAADLLKIKTDALELEKTTKYQCSKCSRTYEEGIKFCPEDGAKIEEVEIEVKKANYNEFMSDMINFLTNSYNQTDEDKAALENFPYEYLNYIDEEMEDTSNYMLYHLFKRKSDGKVFYFSSYSGDNSISKELVETKQETRVVWDFQNT